MTRVIIRVMERIRSLSFVELLPVIVVLVGTAIAGVILFGPKITGGGAAEHTAIETCAGTNNFKCYEAYLTDKATSSDAVQAIEVLKKAYAVDEYVKSQCHQLTHVVGHAAYEKYGSLAAAYTKGDGFCWSGYYHGVTEEAVGDLGADGIRAEANNICAELARTKPYSFDHYNCVHGLGHGFLTVDNFELFKALTSCDLLHSSWDRESCYGGVFMENVMVVARGTGGTTAYLKPSEPLYPCTAVDTPYKQQCYLMQTSYALQQNGYNFAEVFRLCRDVADTSYTTTCYQSAGRDASGSTLSDIEQTKSKCTQAPDTTGIENCMLGAVRDFVSYYHNDSKAKALCASFGADLEPRCVQEVDVYYRTF